MRVGSLFSGAGGFDLGLEAAGMKVVWQAEVEKHASAVLRSRFPGIPNLGDVRGVDGTRVGAIDILCGGFPCQDLSVAGARAGLAGARSGLFWEFVRIAREAKPEWVLLENVPGLLSSHGGRDFGAVLGALAELGYWWAYRILDARFFGVAQRRRRVFIVGRLGARGAGEVLLEPEGLRRNPEKSRKAGKEAPSFAGNGSGARGLRDEGPPTDRMSFVPAVSRSLAAHGCRQDGESETFVTHSLRAEGFDASEDGTGRGTPLTVAFNARQDPDSWTSHTGPLDTDGGTQAVMLADPRRHNATHRGVIRERPCLNASNNDLLWNVGVRRLTPTECERLQGWPDGWTALGCKPDGTQYALADGHRYKLCGNGVAAPVAEWIARRMLAVAATGKAEAAA